MPSSSRSFCSNFSRPSRNDAARLRRRPRSRGTGCSAPTACDASVCASARSPSRCRSSTLGERARQIVVDELQRAAHRLDADLDEDAGRILDVVARRLNQARRLPQLRQHAAGALGRRRVREQRLAGQARREDVGVELRVASPRCAPPRARTSGRGCARPACGARAARPAVSAVGVDLVEAAQVAGERVGLAVDRRAG